MTSINKILALSDYQTLQIFHRTMVQITSLAIVLTTFQLCSSKIVPVIYEEYEICTEPGKSAGKFDFSELEIFAVSDTKVFLNGTWIFLKEVKSPWTTNIFTERYDRGQWNIELISKNTQDFCEVIQNPNEPWYGATSMFEHKYCPFPAGVSFLKFIEDFAL